MAEPQAYLERSLSCPPRRRPFRFGDGGFVQGTTVAEQLRTFGGKLFRLEAHIERLFRSLAICRGRSGRDARASWPKSPRNWPPRNHALLAAGDDLGLTHVRHARPLRSHGCGRVAPTVCLHTFPLRFDLWADKYTQRRIAGHDRRRAGLGPLLAAGVEMPQPHALLPGRSAGAARVFPAAGP